MYKYAGPRSLEALSAWAGGGWKHAPPHDPSAPPPQRPKRAGGGSFRRIFAETLSSYPILSTAFILMIVFSTLLLVLICVAKATKQSRSDAHLAADAPAAAGADADADADAPTRPTTRAASKHQKAD